MAGFIEVQLSAVLAVDIKVADRMIAEHPADKDYWSGYRAHAVHAYEVITGEQFGAVASTDLKEKQQ